jgi:hypothetical protein
MGRWRVSVVMCRPLVSGRHDACSLQPSAVAFADTSALVIHPNPQWLAFRAFYHHLTICKTIFYIQKQRKTEAPASGGHLRYPSHSVECSPPTTSMLPYPLKHNHTSVVWGHEITTKLFYGFLQLVHTHWSFTVRAIIHWTLETPSCALCIQGVNTLVHHPSRFRWFRCIPAFHAPPFGTYKIDLYHLLGQAMPILDSWWHIFILGEPSKNQSLI